MFGVAFPELSYPMDMSNFTQIAPFHWILDMNNVVGTGQSYHQFRQIFIFLVNSSSLPPGKALAVHIQPPGHPTFISCGAVHLARPSAMLSLPWPHPADPIVEPAKVSVSVRDLAALQPTADSSTPLKTNPSWLSLPSPLVEQILERLPLSDYVRFAAVCRKWRSVQMEHRFHYAPNPPPMLPVPWLIVPAVEENGTIICYSPFEKRSYRFRVPIPFNACVSVFPNVWLLLRAIPLLRRSSPSSRPLMGAPELLYNPLHMDTSEDGACLSLWNPISLVHIQLPWLEIRDFNAAMSLSRPDWSILIISIENEYLYLFRADDPDWTKLPFPPQVEGEGVEGVVFFGGKFYCQFSLVNFAVVDPLNEPTVQYVAMDASQIRTPIRGDIYDLMESNGDLLLLDMVMEDTTGPSVGGFRVFKADLSRKVWVRIQSIGDHMLMFHNKSYISLLAVNVGGRRNSIYFLDDMPNDGIFRRPVSWKIFELGAGKITGALRNTEPQYDLSLLDEYSMYWTMPSIC